MVCRAVAHCWANAFASGECAWRQRCKWLSTTAQSGASSVDSCTAQCEQCRGAGASCYNHAWSLAAKATRIGDRLSMNQPNLIRALRCSQVNQCLKALLCYLPSSMQAFFWQALTKQMSLKAGAPHMRALEHGNQRWRCCLTIVPSSAVEHQRRLLKQLTSHLWFCHGQQRCSWHLVASCPVAERCQ
jgi:hypothetical protein